MAKTTQNLIFLSMFMLLSPALASLEPGSFYRTLSPESLGINLKREKLSHIHFFFHDTFTGSNPTTVTVAQSPSTNTSKSLFGIVNMMDDPLTTGPEPNSTVIGRAQGIYASASQSDVSFLMVLNYVFTQGKYNGSTLSVLGRNNVMSEIREMPIISGSGLFRFARGYAQAKTHTLNIKTGDAVVEYNVYVFHY